MASLTISKKFGSATLRHPLKPGMEHVAQTDGAVNKSKKFCTIMGAAVIEKQTIDNAVRIRPINAIALYA